MKRNILYAALVLLGMTPILANLPFWTSPFLQEAGDLAANALQVERAREFQELLGPYSQHRFHHPGPVSFYYFAFTEFLFPWAPALLARHMLAQYVLNILCLVGLASLLRKIGLGAAGALGATLLAAAQLVFLGGGGPVLLASVWGPVIAALPTTLYIVAAARLAQGRLGVLPLMVVTGTLAAHNHLSHGAVLLWITLAAVGWLLLRHRHGVWRPEPPQRRRLLVLSGIMLIPALLPIILEQATGDPGNLTLMFRFFRTHGPEYHPWVEIADKLGQAVTDPLIVLGFPLGLHTPLGVMLLTVGLMVATVLQYRRSGRSWRTLLVFLWLAVLIAVASARTVTGNLHTYLFYFLHPVCGLLYFVLFKELCERCLMPFPRIQPMAPSSLTVALAALLFFVPWLVGHRIAPPPPEDRYQDIVDHFDLNPRDAIHLHWDRKGDNVPWDIIPTLALRFRRDGGRVSVPDSELFICGQEMKSFMTPHPQTLVVTRRRPVGDDDRFFDGEHWGVFLITPADGSPAEFMDSLPPLKP